MDDDTPLTVRDVQIAFNKRDGRTVSYVARAFDTVGELRSAVASDRDLTDYHGVNDRTAARIHDWADTRHDTDSGTAPFTRTAAEIAGFDKAGLAEIINREAPNVTDAEAQYAFELLTERFDGDQYAAYDYQQFGETEVCSNDE